MARHMNTRQHVRGQTHRDMIAELSTIPGIQTCGFWKAMRSVDASYLAYMLDDPEYMFGARFTPDAFLINHDQQAVTIYEVVDHSDITPPKMGRIADFAFVLDEDYWTLKLVYITARGVTEYSPLSVYICAQANPMPDGVHHMTGWQQYANVPAQ